MKIGVFDSGLGGLTIVKSLQEKIKDASLIYVADSRNAPYGSKAPEEITSLSLTIAEYLVSEHQVDALVVACNTATAFAISLLRERYPELIIVGTEPGLKPALEQTKSGHIGILATEATLQGEKYQQLVEKLSRGREHIQVFEQACIGLVEKIEEAKQGAPETVAMLEQWLMPMVQNSVDTIVLGCTHYPLVEREIRALVPENTILIHTGDAIANRLISLRKMTPPFGKDLTLTLFATGVLDPELVERVLGGKQMIRALVL